MGKESIKLTVFFEEPFWVGVVEKQENGRLSASKITFGTEPKDYEIYEFLRKAHYSLEFSPAVKAAVKEVRANPKKLQREIRKQIQKKGIGTRSQRALKLQQEENKLERKVKSREQKQAETERRFELKQQKKKEKHRGR